MATAHGRSAAHSAKGARQQAGTTQNTLNEADIDYEALAPTWHPSCRLQGSQPTADATFVLEDDMVAEVCNEMLHGNWCLTDVRQASNQIMAVSTGFQALTGYTAAELVGKSPSRVLHGPHTRQEAVAAWVSATSSQTASTVELTIHKKSGRPVPVRDYIMPVSDSSGAPWLCLEFVLSISDDRKQSSAQQQQQRQVEQAVQHNRYLEQVQQNAGALLITAVTPTSDVVVKSCSGHLASLTGYSQADLQDSSILALLGPDTSSSSTRHFLAAQLSGKAAVAKLLLYRKDGSPFWALLATSPCDVQQAAATNTAGGAVQQQQEDSEQKQHVVLVVNITSSRQRRVGKYLLGKVLGQGASGLVRVGKNTVTDEIVAVKAVDATRFHSITEIEQVQEEMAVLATLKHQNIIRLLEVQFVGSCFYFIMEYASGGSMVRYIYSQEGGRLSELQARQLFGQILSALEYCHKRRVIHRDLKPENILMEGDLPKIADFGLAGVVNTFSGTGFTLQCGTPEFTAPEIVEGKEYEGPAVDLWSVGVMLYEALSGHLPFKGSSQTSLFKAIQRGVYPPLPQSVSSEARDLVKRLLTTDPTARIGWSELGRHPWLACGSPSAGIPPRFRTSSMGQQTCTADGGGVGSSSIGNSSAGLSRLKSESIAGLLQDSCSGSGIDLSKSIGGSVVGSGSGSDRFAASLSRYNQETDDGCQSAKFVSGSGRSSCSQEEVSDAEAGDADAAAWVADALSNGGSGAGSAALIAAARLEAVGGHRIAASFTSSSCHESVRVVIPDSNQDDPITAAIKQRLAGGDCGSLCSDSSSDHCSPNTRAYSFSGGVSPATPGGTRASQTMKTGLGKILTSITSPSAGGRNSGCTSTLPPLSPSGTGGGGNLGRSRHSVMGGIKSSSSGSGSPSSRARSGSTTSPLKERIKGSLLNGRAQGNADCEGSLPPISREKSMGRRGV